MNHIDISSEFCDASGELIPLKELLGPLVLPTLDTAPGGGRGVDRAVGVLPPPRRYETSENNG